MAEAHARSADALAPWAEIVPHTGLKTEEELLALPEDGWQYELVEGRLVRMIGSSPERLIWLSTLPYPRSVGRP